MYVLFEPGKALRGSILEDGDVGDRLRRNAWSDWKYARDPVPNGPARQNFIELAVIITGEIDDPVASGHRSRDAHRRHDSFRASVAEGHPLVAREFAKELCNLPGEGRLGAQLKALVNLCDQRIPHEIRRMTKGCRPKAVQQIDINVAVDIPQLRALGTDRDDWIDDFLPFRVKPGGNTRIGKNGPRCLSELLGSPRAACVALDQIGKEPALSFAKTGAAGLRERFERAESFRRFF